MFEYIEKLFLFKNVDFAYANEKYGILNRTVVSEYDDGQSVLTSDDGRDGVFVVLDGGGYICSASKKHYATLRCLKKGDTFGAASLFGAPTEHKTKVIAKNYLKTAVLPVDLISELLEKESKIALNYICFLSDRVSFLNRKITAFSAGSAEEKLALYLLSLPCESNVITLNESYTEIAKILDIGRASLYRAIETFENAEIICRSGKQVCISDRDKLLQMVNW